MSTNPSLNIRQYRERLTKAAEELGGMAKNVLGQSLTTYEPQARMRLRSDASRLAGKVEGIKLALSYLDEEMR